MIKVSVKQEELRDAFDIADFGADHGTEAFLDPVEGRIYLRCGAAENAEDLPSDLDDGPKYIAIPRKTDLGLGKPLALGFAAPRREGAYPKVQSIFNHPGAYANPLPRS